MVERGNDRENLGIFMGGVGKSPRQQVTGERQTAPAHSNFKYIPPMCIELLQRLNCNTQFCAITDVFIKLVLFDKP